MSVGGHVLALAGGVGGARLAHGLAAILRPEDLTVAVNTGDDFDHFGLRICPDLDTVTYTLAGIGNPELGWGIAGETWNFMAAVERLGGETWFRLGDRDLATHVERTRRLAKASLSEVTKALCRTLGVASRVTPMSDDPVRTFVHTDAGRLAFQDYFVRRQCGPRFLDIEFEGVESARPAPGVLTALENTRLDAVILCPSNPLLSIRPIVSVPGLGERLRLARAPRVAVSPFIGGEAVKGPAAKIMRELGLEPRASTLAVLYDGLIDGLVVSTGDAEGVPPQISVLETDTLMRDDGDRARLAAEVLGFARQLAS